ncbi:MAG: class I SAM-dependent methyltransferase [Acidimicrobiaceae bacterium]|nr:class I SAM-dependent methyltransferase [Acidimicrobiaceae bacterium]
MRTEFDPDRLPLTILELFRIKQGEMVSALMHLGTRLGLWEALRDSGPCTSVQLAEATGLQERWVREWLHGLAATELVQHDDGRFALTPEARVALTDSEHWSFMPGVFGPPMTHYEIERTAEAFRTGVGMTWGEHGDHTCHMQCAMSAARQESFLVPVVLASFDGAIDRLRAGGARIVDVGCGAGVAARLLASSFPEATVVGVDPSDRAIAAARAEAQAAGLDNLTFENGTFDDLNRFGPVDLLVTLDVLHDLPRPQDAVAAAMRNLSADGWWLVADIKGRGDLESNRKIPVLPYMYAMSVFYCMSSALSEPGGEGLGTLGLHPARLEEMVTGAGFTRFARHEVELDPTNWYYEIRL